MADVTKIKLPNGSEYDIKDNVSGYITAQTTLAGYGITDAKIQDGVITLGSNSITPLTSFTETDPTVPSWAKAASKPTYTATEVGAISTSVKGAANGVAELDANGLVPSSQLPSYVDDVLEYDAKSSFPSTGETGKIYVDISTNLTYRWGGSAYVEISPSLALGTTSSTAFRGDYGDAAYAHAVTNKGSAFTSGLYKITTNSEGHVIAAIAATASDIPDLSSIYLTSETDPIFTASVAAGITSTDITNWNSKSDTDEKVKAVDNGDSGSYRYLVMGTASGNAETKYYNTTLSFANTSSTSTLNIGNGSHKGKIGLYTGTNNYAQTKLVSTATNTTRTISFPDSDGTVALTATTLAGYGITDAKIENGTITLGSNTITPLTSYTETDPIFTASAAYGITSSDITNWNNKISDDKTWNGVTLNTLTLQTDSGVYVPILASISSEEAQLVYATSTPSIEKIAKYDSNSYLNSTTTASNDSSTKVATTAFVQTIISNKADSATTLAGYGITDAYISNGTITLGSNSITPLTSFTESDPVFTASAAYGITSANITNWNGKAETSDIPDSTSDLTNDSGFITSQQTQEIFVQSTTPSGASDGDIWADTGTTTASGIAYLPLTAGSDKPLTGDLYLDNGATADQSVYFEQDGTRGARMALLSDGGIRVATCDDNNSSIAGMFVNASGQSCLFSNGADVVLRPNGISDTTGQVYFDTDGQQHGGHGFLEAETTTSTSISASTWTTLCTVTLTPGLWIVSGTAHFKCLGASSDAWGMVCVGHASGAMAARQAISLGGATSVYLGCNATYLLDVTASSYTVDIYANASAATSISQAYLKAINVG